MSSTVIDHAIAIPTKQRNVWEHIRDLQKNPLWQVECRSIAFLTTNHSGRGTRYRSTSPKGAAQVIEITAWYEGLGYEYIIVDGTGFANNRGRIRLQESTEGTIVQWTFSYEITGLLGGIRNAFSIRPRVDNEIIDGLRNLYAYIKEIRGEETFRAQEASSYPREAPNVEARYAYKPRHPSRREQSAGTIDSPLAPPARVGIVEPPVADDDTTPNPTIQTPDTPKVEPMPEPTFLKDMPDFSTRPPGTLVKPEPLPRLEESEDTESVTAPAPASQRDDSTAILTPSEEVIPAPQPPEDEADALYIGPLPGLESEELSDSSKVSVFEVFGLPKPSETEKLRAIQGAEISSAEQSATDTGRFRFMAHSPIVPDVEPEAPRRQGLRAALRQRNTHVRLPK